MEDAGIDGVRLCSFPKPVHVLRPSLDDYMYVDLP